MRSCPESRRVQDYLDRELPAQQEQSFRAHLEVCRTCAKEVEAYRRAFEYLDRLPLFAPSPSLTDRILERVLPSRVRRRWIAAFGWGYAAALAATLVGSFLLLSRPGVREMIESLWGAASQRLVQAVTFSLNAVAFALVGLADGWGLVTTLGQRLAPLGHAVTSPLSHPAIQLALGLAAISCIAVLWWLRSRENGSADEAHHVGVVGF